MIDNNNYKPFRTKAQKAEARRTARKINGTWVSNAPVSYHKHKEHRMALPIKGDQPMTR